MCSGTSSSSRAGQRSERLCGCASLALAVFATHLVSDKYSTYLPHNKSSVPPAADLLMGAFGLSEDAALAAISLGVDFGVTQLVRTA